MKDHGTAPDMRIWCGLILWEIWFGFVPLQMIPLQMRKDQLPFSLVQQQVLAEGTSSWAYQGEQLGPPVGVGDHIGEAVVHSVIHPRQIGFGHRILQRRWLSWRLT